jgi:hypothetical protein
MSRPPVPAGPGTPAEPAAGRTRPGFAGLIAGALTIVAIADDPELLDAIARAGSGHDVVITSPTADRFVDQLVANGAAIAVIDAGCAPQPLAGFIERIHAQFPQLLLILAGSATLQAAFANFLVDGTLFRFAHKPASAQRMQLFIDAARRHLESGEPAAPVASGAAPDDPDAAPARRWLRTATFGALVLATLLGLGWWQLHTPAVAPGVAIPAAALTAVALPSGPQPVVPPVVAPPVVGPGADLPASDAAARTAAMIAPLDALPPVRAAMSPESFLELARARLESHELLEPAGDSALYYVQAAQALSPQDSEVGATALALGEALIAQTRQALNRGDLAAARRWLQACTDYRVSENAIAELSARLRQLAAAAAAGPSNP